MSYYDYGTDFDVFVGTILIFLLGFILIGFAIWIFNIITTWKVYKKSGFGGWEAIIPFYDNWILVKAAGLNGWWFLLIICPFILIFVPLLNALSFVGSIVSSFALFNCFYNLSKRFNKGVGFAFGLLFLRPIFMAILGFSKNNIYNANINVSNNGVFNASIDNNTNVNYEYQQQNNMYNQQVNQGFNNSTTPFSFCGNCGTKIANEAKFCPICGTQKQ